MSQASLFQDDPESDPPRPKKPASTSRAAAQKSEDLAALRVVRVLPDEPAIKREFDYVVPASWTQTVEVGTPVRIPLHGRRVRGWVTEVDVQPAPDLALQELLKHSGVGPDESVLSLARWVAHRWAGSTAAILRTASPPVQVKKVLQASASGSPSQGLAYENLAAALAQPATSVVRCPPHTDEVALIRQAAALGQLLIVTPTASRARELAVGCRRSGLELGLLPRDWAKVAGGISGIGPRSAIFSRMSACSAIVVFDAHDENLQGEQTPTWNARDVAVERARRLGVPCVLISPTPDLATLALGKLYSPSRAEERAGWPATEIIDRRGDAPGPGSMFSERLVDLVRGDRRVVCVLNRKGRAQLLRCANCDALGCCEKCGSSVRLDADLLVCPVCETERPQVCLSCHSTKFKRLRPGVKRIAEELEALAGRRVLEVTGDTGAVPDSASLLVGTEAVLHRVSAADVVVFLDIDGELLAPRYRAVEQAMAQMARAARLLGGRTGGRLVIQTRQPRHVAIQAILSADPARVAESERTVRTILGFPPDRALAQISGTAAPTYVAGLKARGALDLRGPADGSWLAFADDSGTLGDALAQVERPTLGRLRVAVDPLRV